MKKYKTLEELMNAAEYVVECDTTRIFELWDKWNETLRFEQALSGFGKNVGDFHGHPVIIGVFYYLIGGKLVVFWSAESMVVNHYMIDTYLKEAAPEAKYGCSNNFHTVIHEIEDSLNKQGTP